MTPLRHSDGRIHWSDLKNIAKSPAHYREAIEHPRQVTPAMLRGTAIDKAVFGGKMVRCDVARGTLAWDAIELLARGADVAVYPGKVARGAEYDKFVAGHPPTMNVVTQAAFDVAFDLLGYEQCDLGAIVTTDEYENAQRAAHAVRTDPVVKEERLLDGQYQQVIQWEMHGLPFAAGVVGVRGGLDILGASHLADLKGTTITEPEAWMRQAERMLYHGQLACYDEAALSIGVKPTSHWLIGIEFKAPYNVVCLRATERMMDKGRKLVAAMCETLRNCESSNHWPGYVQAAVDWEPNEDRNGFGQLEGDDDNGET